MKARCLVSFFAQNVSGTQDTVIEVKDQQLFDELVKSGYIEAIETQSPSKDEHISTNPEELHIKNTRAKKASGLHEDK